MTDHDELMAEAKRRYLEGIPARLEALEAGLSELREGSAQAASTIRRMAHTLRGSGSTLGFPEVTAAASEAEDADDDELVEKTETLIEVLKNVDSGSAAGPASVLIIEDDPMSATLARTAVDAPQRDIEVADSYAAAEEALSSGDWDVILLDLFLPDGDGRDLLIRVRREPETAAVPVIVMSGSESKAARAECFALGADDFFTKPLDPAVFSSAVARHLQRSSHRAPEALQDRLTGLANRAAAAERFEELRGSDQELAVALMDVDDLHVINEEHGRDFGDRVLAHVGEVMRGIRSDDGELWARWDGEEFVALFPGRGPEAAAGRVAEALEALRDSPMEAPGGDDLEVTFSAGVAAAGEAEELRDALASASRRLYEARRSGESANILAQSPGGEGEDSCVLLVEDDPVIASLIKHRLGREGFDVEHFDDGLEAHQFAEGRAAAMAILDVKVPGMDGFQLLGKLRDMEAYSDVPIMMLTSMNREEDIVRGFDLGADEYMLKPFSPVELVARVCRLIRRK